MSPDNKDGQPQGWITSTLGEICEKPEYGWTTKAAKTGDLKLLRTTDLSGGSVDWASVPFCSEKPTDGGRYRLHPGEIVISRAGSVGFSFLIGDCPEAVFASYLIRFRPFEGMNARYLSFFLQSPEYWQQVANSTAGIALQNVNAKKLAAITIAVAPTAEQRRIVAEIEKQFTRLDAAVAALKRMQANLKRYRAAVLKAAVEGRLVPTEAELARAEGRSYEPASELLQRILAERRARWEAGQLAKMRASGKEPKDDRGKAKYEEPAGPETADLPSLPGGWTWATVGQVTTLVTKGTSPGWQGFEYVDRGVLFVRSQNVGWGKLDLSDLVCVDPRFNTSHGNSMIREGDVLLNLVGASVGRSALATSEIEGANTNQAVGILRLVSDGAINRFLMLYLLSPPGQSHIHKTKADVARANFNLDDIRPTAFPLPPQIEQLRIVQEAERRLSVIDELEMQVEASLKRSERLRQAVLKRAFEGKLVPQDPDDEPASVLLERIRAERKARTQRESEKNVSTRVQLRKKKAAV